MLTSSLSLHNVLFTPVFLDSVLISSRPMTYSSPELLSLELAYLSLRARFLDLLDLLVKSFLRDFYSFLISDKASAKPPLTCSIA